MATLNTNQADAITAALTLTTESVITLYVLPISGAHKKHRVILEISPDGTKFQRTGKSVRSGGVETYIVAALKARAKVIRPEGATSTSDVFVIAR